MSKVAFRTVTEETSELMRNWRNDPRISVNMFNNDHISAENQLKWFHRQAQDDSSRYFVCFLDDKPVGSLSFTDIEPEKCFWGCYIGEQRILPGFGLVLEYAALDYAFSSLGVNELWAEVLDFNTGPQKMHAFFEYESTGTIAKDVVRDGEHLKAIQYRYTKNQWQDSQQKILAKLPKHLAAICKDISFS